MRINYDETCGKAYVTTIMIIIAIKYCFAFKRKKIKEVFPFH